MSCESGIAKRLEPLPEGLMQMPFGTFPGSLNLMCGQSEAVKSSRTWAYRAVLGHLACQTFESELGKQTAPHGWFNIYFAGLCELDLWKGADILVLGDFCSGQKEDKFRAQGYNEPLTTMGLNRLYGP